MIRTKFGHFNFAPRQTVFDANNMASYVTQMTSKQTLTGNARENNGSNSSQCSHKSSLCSGKITSTQEPNKEDHEEDESYSPRSEDNQHQQNVRKRGNDHLSSSDFDQLCYHFEKCAKNNITKTFKSLIELHHNSQQGELLKTNELVEKIASLQQERSEVEKTLDGEKKALEEKIAKLEQQRIEEQTKFSEEKLTLEKKIAELEGDKTKKTCISCDKVIDSLAYCNSDCLKWVLKNLPVLLLTHLKLFYIF